MCCIVQLLEKAVLKEIQLILPILVFGAVYWQIVHCWNAKAAHAGYIFSLELQKGADCTAQKITQKTETGALCKLMFI